MAAPPPRRSSGSKPVLFAILLLALLSAAVAAALPHQQIAAPAPTQPPPPPQQQQQHQAVRRAEAEPTPAQQTPSAASAVPTDPSSAQQPAQRRQPAPQDSGDSDTVDDSVPSYSYLPNPPPLPSPRKDNGLGMDGALGIANDGGDAAGANGREEGAAKLGTGGIVGIAVGVTVVVLVAVVFWVLWYMAKKRSWAEVRASIKSVPRRLTGSIRPASRKNESWPPRKPGENSPRDAALAAAAANAAANGGKSGKGRIGPARPKPSFVRVERSSPGASPDLEKNWS